MAWEFINSQDAPVSSAYDFPELDLTNYDIVQVVLSGMRCSGAPENIGFHAYIDGVEKTTLYDFFQVGRHHGSTQDDPESGTGSGRLHTQGTNFYQLANGAKHIFGAKLFIANPTVAVAKPWWSTAQYHGYGTAGTESVLLSAYGGGALSETGIIDGLKFIGTTGLSAGKVVIFGLNPT